MGRNAVDSNAVFIDDLFIPEEDRIGEEGRGFSYILDSLNPERILVGGGGHRHRPGRAAAAPRTMPANASSSAGRSARTRASSIRWPNAGPPRIRLLMAMQAAWLYDSGQPCGAEANAAKFLGGRAGYDACLQAVMTHGGMGYAKEYQVERLLREVMITRIAPVTEQLILSFIAERVLDLPKSY